MQTLQKFTLVCLYLQDSLITCQNFLCCLFQRRQRSGLRASLMRLTLQWQLLGAHGQKLGDAEDPLLVSVRSGILHAWHDGHLVLNLVLTMSPFRASKQTGNERFLLQTSPMSFCPDVLLALLRAFLTALEDAIAAKSREGR